VHDTEEDVFLGITNPHTLLGKGEERRIRLMKNNEPLGDKHHAKKAASALQEIAGEGERR
jgi:hypothetical protein